MNGNTRIGFGPENIERHRKSLKVWFRGQVVSIGNMEDILIEEEMNRLIPVDDISTFHERTKLFMDSKWAREFLESREGFVDHWYRDKWVK